MGRRARSFFSILANSLMELGWAVRIKANRARFSSLKTCAKERMDVTQIFGSEALGVISPLAVGSRWPNTHPLDPESVGAGPKVCGWHLWHDQPCQLMIFLIIGPQSPRQGQKGCEGVIH